MSGGHTLIIGAGPYGISLALELSAQRRPFTLVGRPFQLWFDHTPNEMRLRSDRPSSEIPSPDHAFKLDRFESQHGPSDAAAGERMPVTHYRRYLRWVLEQLPFAPRDETVIGLEPRGSGFRAELSGGEWVNADQVVIATGLGAYAFIPESLRAERVIHSYQLADWATLRGERVLVVGGGQSAGEAIRRLRADNEVHWAHREPIRYYNVPLNLPGAAFSVLSASPWLMRRLPSAWVADALRRFSGPTISPDLAPLIDDVPRVALGERGASGYPVVVACTGFKVSLERLPFLSASLRERVRCEDSVPVLDRRFQSSCPGLFFIGAAAERAFGPTLRFVLGSGFAAKTVAAALVSSA